MVFDNPRVVHLWVEQGRVLELRVRCLTSECGKARNSDAGNTASNRGIGRKTGIDEAGIGTDRKREFACSRTRETDACVEQLIGADHARVAAGDLLIENTLLAVGAAVEGKAEDREVSRVGLEMRGADEDGVLRVDCVVQTKVALVGVVV